MQIAQNPTPNGAYTNQVAGPRKVSREKQDYWPRGCPAFSRELTYAPKGRARKGREIISSKTKREAR